MPALFYLYRNLNTGTFSLQHQGKLKFLKVFMSNNNGIEAIIDDSLNAACLSIQKALGITDGGVAAAFFSDGRYQALMREYIEHEYSFFEPNNGIQNTLSSSD
jgi:hypothetical protein